ncbi:unnamed protein product [Linum tenue]|uniref:Uncharacterized protein n=1 Tax=Linum tenue TaxID=586396 RepID=A0AAV0PCT1_9ROSI|nr:unnamed protein product [Linum tenue]
MLFSEGSVTPNCWRSWYFLMVRPSTGSPLIGRLVQLRIFTEAVERLVLLAICQRGRMSHLLFMLVAVITISQIEIIISIKEQVAKHYCIVSHQKHDYFEISQTFEGFNAF